MAQKNKGEVEFEKILEELEQILEQLENGSLSLDDSISKYERAQECLNVCRQKLENAELRINKINGNSLEKFNPDTNQ
ncbi:MAG: exodeoxyribonuclease VII small subunit [Opitutales bacterium]|nr:exodeoxyribonuclease VII small subunit [Opitutales bacterium]